MFIYTGLYRHPVCGVTFTSVNIVANRVCGIKTCIEEPAGSIPATSEVANCDGIYRPGIAGLFVR